jgi:hypothetical protein
MFQNHDTHELGPARMQTPGGMLLSGRPGLQARCRELAFEQPLKTLGDDWLSLSLT